MSVLYTQTCTHMYCTQTRRQMHTKSPMLLLTGFGALRTKLSLLTVSFGLVGINPELPFSWKNSISIPGSKNQGSLSQRGKKRHGREAGDLHTFPPPSFSSMLNLQTP